MIQVERLVNPGNLITIESLIYKKEIDMVDC